MKFELVSSQLEKLSTDCLILPIYNEKQLTGSVKKLDKLLDGYLTAVLKKGDIQGETGQILLLAHTPFKHISRILLVGCGKDEPLTTLVYKRLNAQALAAVKTTTSVNVCSFLHEVAVKDQGMQWKIRQSIQAAQEQFYRFDDLKTHQPKKEYSLKKIDFYMAAAESSKQMRQVLKEGAAIMDGMHLTRKLGNLPANICTPSYMATAAKKLAKKYKSLSVNVLGKAELQKIGMGAMLAVAQGSYQPPQFIIVSYAGQSKKQPPIVLIGKGVTFDSGGISIKPAPQMDEMKFDMCGAASILGTLQAVAELKLPLNVIGLMPCAENMPGGRATRPGDVVTSMSGKTIEILNTDAEGRLLLCDALTYAEKLHPALVIDVATLTGAVVVALGTHISGVFSQHENLVNELVKAGNDSGDRTWPMPMIDAQQDELKSNFADLANVGSRFGSSITAACFLERFAEKFPWAHIDIAGVAMKMGDQKGATGRPVPLLTQFLINHSQK